jgi:hypothetical protein
MFERGRYRWGSGYLVVDSAFNIDQAALDRVLEGARTNRAMWKSAQELDWLLLFLHEAAHFMQDLSTGAGNWDFFKRARAIGPLRYLSSHYMDDTSHIPGDDLGPEWYTVYSREWTVEPRAGAWSDGPELERYLQTRDAILSSVDNHHRSLITEWLWPKEGRASGETARTELFEADAHCSVSLFIGGMSKSSAQMDLILQSSIAREWFNNTNGEAHRIHEIPLELLRETHVGIRLSSRYSTINQSRAIAMMINLLASLSLAVPPPVTDSPLPDFYPEIKFTDLLGALTKMDSDNAEIFWKKLDDSELDDAEQLILPYCQIKYPRIKDVENRWCYYMDDAVDHLDGAEKFLLQYRIQCCRHNATTATHYYSRSICDILSSGSLITGISVRQGKVMAFGGVSKKELVLNLEALTTYNLHWDIARLTLNREIFDCPLDDFHQCAVSTKSCKAGHTRVQQFPLENCRARRYVDNIISLRRSKTVG